MRKLISDNQCALVSGRQIMDHGMLLANEVIHNLRKGIGNNEGVVLK